MKLNCSKTETGRAQAESEIASNRAVKGRKRRRTSTDRKEAYNEERKPQRHLPRKALAVLTKTSWRERTPKQSNLMF